MPAESQDSTRRGRAAVDAQTVAGLVALALLGAGAYLVADSLRALAGAGAGLGLGAAGLVVGLALYRVVNRAPKSPTASEG